MCASTLQGKSFSISFFFVPFVVVLSRRCPVPFRPAASDQKERLAKTCHVKRLVEQQQQKKGIIICKKKNSMQMQICTRPDADVWRVSPSPWPNTVMPCVLVTGSDPECDKFSSEFVDKASTTYPPKRRVGDSGRLVREKLMYSNEL